MTRISQTDLIKDVADRIGISAAIAKETISTFIDTVQTNVKRGNTVNLHGFMTIGTRRRKRFKSRNPKTGESIQVPASTVISVKVSNSFKSIVDAKKRAAAKKAAKKAATKRKPAKKAAKKTARKITKRTAAKKAPAKRRVTRTRRTTTKGKATRRTRR